MLVMLDLDNTLVDRRGAFTTWVSDFVAGLDGDTTDVEWLLAADRDGYRSRVELAALMREHFDLNRLGFSAVFIRAAPPAGAQ